jgi:hypothetical protein
VEAAITMNLAMTWTHFNVLPSPSKTTRFHRASDAHLLFSYGNCPPLSVIKDKYHYSTALSRLD